MFILQFILDAGATVMLPVIIFILGLILGAGPAKSFRAGITIGVGFTGIFLMTGLLSDNLAPVAQMMIERLGLHFDIVDVGWPAMSAITWGWTAAGLVIPICLVINIAMLAVGLTKTMDVDIWNYWQFAFIGAAVAEIAHSVPLGLAAAGIAGALAFVLADVTAHYIEEFYMMPGISFPHYTALGMLPIVIPLVWLTDRIPGLKDINVSAEDIREKFGLFGEPMMMGLIIGLVLGILAGAAPEVILQTGIGLAAFMHLMPRMVAVLMEGLMPISEAARNLMQERFEGREIYIGLDAAVALGDPSVTAVGLLLVPITILLAVILPGNRILPFADLAVIPYIVSLFTAMCKGDVIRSLIIGTVVMALVLYLASYLGPIQTPMAANVGFEFPEGAAMIGNLDRANIVTAAFVWLAGLIGG